MLSVPVAKLLGGRYAGPPFFTHAIDDAQSGFERGFYREGKEVYRIVDYHIGGRAHAPGTALFQSCTDLFVYAGRREANIEEVQLWFLSAEIAGNLLHQVFGESIAVSILATVFVCDGQLLRHVVRVLEADGGNGTGQHHFFTTTRGEVLQQHSGAFDVDQHTFAFDATSGDGCQVHESVDSVGV